jgi:hypothetical protein
MDSKNPQRVQGAEGLEIAGNDPQAHSTKAPDRATLNLIRTVDNLAEPVHRVAALLHAVDNARDERHVSYLIDIAREEISHAEMALKAHATGAGNG